MCPQLQLTERTFVVDDFLTQLGVIAKTVAVPGESIMTRVGGSRSYNLDIDTSDVDWVGVYVAPLREVVGLDRLKESFVVERPNCEYHEVRLFASLVNKGSPNAIESLFCDRMIHVTAAWENLRAIRHRFVTQRCVRNYVGYGQGQLKKYLAGRTLHTAGGKPGEKWLYHVVRLAKQAVRLAEGGMPNNWAEGEDRDFILRIRRKEVPDYAVIAVARGLFDQADSLAPYRLPEFPDTPALEQWLLHTRGIL